jgi:hypothetical protein
MGSEGVEPTSDRNLRSALALSYKPATGAYWDSEPLLQRLRNARPVVGHAILSASPASRNKPGKNDGQKRRRADQQQHEQQDFRQSRQPSIQAILAHRLLSQRRLDAFGTRSPNPHRAIAATDHIGDNGIKRRALDFRAHKLSESYGRDLDSGRAVKSAWSPDRPSQSCKVRAHAAAKLDQIN